MSVFPILSPSVSSFPSPYHCISSFLSSLLLYLSHSLSPLSIFVLFTLSLFPVFLSLSLLFFCFFLPLHLFFCICPKASRYFLNVNAPLSLFLPLCIYFNVFMRVRAYLCICMRVLVHVCVSACMITSKLKAYWGQIMLNVVLILPLPYNRTHSSPYYLFNPGMD